MNTIKNQPIPKEIKEQVLGRIKQDGVSVYQAAKEHGLNPRTIYDWLNKNATQNMSFAEISKLKKENQQLKELVGRLILEIESRLIKKRA